MQSAPLSAVAAFATTARLVLAQEAVPEKTSELAAIPPLLDRLGANGGLQGMLVSIDAMATNADIAEAASLETRVDPDKGHGRLEKRRLAVLFDIGCLVRAEIRVETAGRTQTETRYFISSRPLRRRGRPRPLGHREPPALGSRNVTFGDDQPRLRNGLGALYLVRTAADKHSIKSRRTIAGWSSDYPQTILASGHA